MDAEELSSIIEGVEKEALPGIEEDVYRSCDSVSTLGSDCLTLESGEIEGDLFEDVRASIQKSSAKSQLASAKTKVGSSSELPGYQTRDRKLMSALCMFNMVGGCADLSSINLIDDLLLSFFFSFQKGWVGFSQQGKLH